MFAPNRLITVKEQWLLLGVIVAILAGSITMYLQRSSHDTQGEVIPLASTDPPASTVPKGPDKRERNMTLAPPAPPEPRDRVAIPEKGASAIAPETRSMPQVPVMEEAPIQMESPDLLSTSPASVTAPRTIGVAVMGAVNKPGLYMTPETYRVADLIGLAGGATPAADLSEIMLTAALIDETTLTVPEKAVQSLGDGHVSIRRGASKAAFNPAQYLKYASRPEQEMPRMPVQTGGSPGGREPVVTPTALHSGGALLNVNQATSEQLQQLPGIGPVLASAIIAEREREPFSAVEDLLRVSGIGEKRLSAIRALITAP